MQPLTRSPEDLETAASAAHPPDSWMCASRAAEALRKHSAARSNCADAPSAGPFCSSPPAPTRSGVQIQEQVSFADVLFTQGMPVMQSIVSPALLDFSSAFASSSCWDLGEGSCGEAHLRRPESSETPISLMVRCKMGACGGLARTQSQSLYSLHSTQVGPTSANSKFGPLDIVGAWRGIKKATRPQRSAGERRVVVVSPN